MLTLSEFFYSADGPRLDENRYTFMYEVNGLPPGEQAWIAEFAEFEGKWQILRVRGGVQGHWAGDYGSPEEALQALK